MRVRHVLPIASLLTLGFVVWRATSEPLPPQSPFDSAVEPFPADELTLPVGTEDVTGRVLADGVGAVAEALVWVEVRGRLVWSFTRPDGTFELRELDAGPARVHVLARGFAPWTFQVVVGDDALDLELPPPRDDPPEPPAAARSDWTGSVGPTGGVPQPAGLVVELSPLAPPHEFGSALPRRATVRADGSFEVQDLVHADYRVLLLPEWAVGGSWPDLLSPSHGGVPTTLRHPEPRPRRLEPLAGRIEGRIYRSGPRNPAEPEGIAAALVFVAPVEPQGTDRPARHWPPAVSDATGRFRIEALPPGDYEVRVRVGDFHPTQRVSVPARERIDLRFPVAGD